jgi:hypothetical protein
MNILDREVAVEQETLRDDQVMRLVAAGDHRRDPPRRQAEQHERDDGRRRARARHVDAKWYA